MFSSLRILFFNRDNGPSASTARHLPKTSQYPSVPAHACPIQRFRLFSNKTFNRLKISPGL